MAYKSTTISTQKIQNYLNPQNRQIIQTQLFLSNPNIIQKVGIKAVYGIIQMETNSYLVVVTQSKLIGQLLSSKIYQIINVEFICIDGRTSFHHNYYIDGRPSLQDNYYIDGLKQIFNTQCYYYSDGKYDLTKSLQQNINPKKPTTQNIKQQYIMNYDWLNKFYEAKADEWTTIFIEGYVGIITKQKQIHSTKIILISRRDKRRQGMRYLRRGIDTKSNTANSVESETIFSLTSKNIQSIFSNVQLRGSMPFIWSQDPDLSWCPKCVIDANEDLNKQLFGKYYDQMKLKYKKITLINLVDKQGQQKMLGQYFQNLHKQLNNNKTKLIWFDFHKECKNMKYQNLAQLLDQIKPEIENYGYFYTQINKFTKQISLKKRIQQGIFRTNCMDCLDRTNVVQCVIARQLLLQWTRIVNRQQQKKDIYVFETIPLGIEEDFKNQWTENANKLSILYSGTPAMKTDFTLIGKRTIRGSLKDGYYGLKRYILGNFYDFRKQDFIDFSLNKLNLKQESKQRIEVSIINSFYLYIILIIMIPFLTYWAVKQLRNEDQSTLLWSIVIGIIGICLFLKLSQHLKIFFIRKPLKKSFE